MLQIPVKEGGWWDCLPCVVELSPTGAIGLYYYIARTVPLSWSFLICVLRLISSPGIFISMVTYGVDHETKPVYLLCGGQETLGVIDKEP